MYNNFDSNLHINDIMQYIDFRAIHYSKCLQKTSKANPLCICDHRAAIRPSRGRHFHRDQATRILAQPFVDRSSHGLGGDPSTCMTSSQRGLKNTPIFWTNNTDKLREMCIEGEGRSKNPNFMQTSCMYRP